MSKPPGGSTPTGALETSLIDRHRASRARLIEFGGWLMPVHYPSGIIGEHHAVRRAAGLFDLSHMGELEVRGPEAGIGLDHALVTEPSALKIGRAHYSMICAPDGGILDDLIVYRLAEEEFLVVPNASNAGLVAATIVERLRDFDAEMDDASRRTGLIAVQGPEAERILTGVSDLDAPTLRYYSIREAVVAGRRALIARTGYTGEDGFEIFLAAPDAPAVWDRLLDAGRPLGLIPAGLGARDTLRLEAGMPLYGNELDTATNPFEARLGRVVKLEKEADFVGRESLERVARAGPERLLSGLIVRGRGIARHGYPVHLDGAADPVGRVTSGTASPTLGVPIAMAYLPVRASEPGTMAEVGIRDARIAAEVVPLPFYTRPA